MTFAKLLSALRVHLPGIKAPTAVRWTLEAGKPMRLVARVPYVELNKNFVGSDGASPAWFAVCFAYWAETFLGKSIKCHVILENPAGTKQKASPHQARAQLVIQELSALIPDQLTWEAEPGTEEWKWPANPVVNVAQQKRTISKGDTHGMEHQLQTQISIDTKLMRQFRADVAPVTRFRQQLPLGLFDEKKGRGTRVTPGGGAQLDLWGLSKDGKTFHAIELKARAKPGKKARKGKVNRKVGILSEAFAYACILNRIRDGQIAGKNRTLDALRKADKVVFWLAAPSFHPLVFSEGKTPLAWINPKLAEQGIEFRVIPFKEGTIGGRTVVERWMAEEVWPAKYRPTVPP